MGWPPALLTVLLMADDTTYFTEEYTVENLRDPQNPREYENHGADRNSWSALTNDLLSSPCHMDMKGCSETDHKDGCSKVVMKYAVNRVTKVQ